MVRSIDIADALFDESNQGEPGIVLVETKEDGDLANFQTLAALDALMTHIRAKDWTYGDATIIDLIRWQMRLTASGGSGFRPTRIDAQTSLPTDSGELRMMLRDIATRGTMDPANPRAFASTRAVKAMARIDSESGQTHYVESANKSGESRRLGVDGQISRKPGRNHCRASEFR